jgi:hypothetical protein
MGRSPQEAMMLGLNLLRLLTQNRIAEFHTELELVPKEVGRPQRGCGCSGHRVLRLQRLPKPDRRAPCWAHRDCSCQCAC